MRISYWSSDVCSSDLGITGGSLHVLGRLLAKGDLQLGQHDVLVVEANKIHAKQIIRLLEAAAPTDARVVLAGDGKGSTGPAWDMRLLAGHLQVTGGLAVEDQIGRAACRERACWTG